MSTSKLALRSKSFEASDLQNTVPTASANRFVAQGYRVRLPNGSYSATPSTGRISSRADRAGHIEPVAWTSAIIDLLGLDPVPTAAFNIGIASGRERDCQYVLISVVAVPLKNPSKTKHHYHEQSLFRT